ncbi:hypothetical protein ADUPG1_004290, partial [Aduncisulcus paluster]
HRDKMGATRETYRIRKLADRDLKKAISVESTVEPPPGMGMSIIRAHTIPYEGSTREVNTPCIEEDADKMYIHPFPPAETKNAIKRIRGTSAGPDGVNGRAIAMIPSEIWRLFFNSVIIQKTI